MKIYQILPNQYLGEILEYPDSEPGIPIGYTRTSIEVPEGLYAIWMGTFWQITENPPQSENENI